jgi:hypothetical protein
LYGTEIQEQCRRNTRENQNIKTILISFKFDAHIALKKRGQRQHEPSIFYSQTVLLPLYVGERLEEGG